MANQLHKKDIFIELSDAELKRFHTVLQDMHESTHKAWGKIVRNMARDATRLMLKYTGIAPKERRQKVTGSNKYWMHIQHRYTGEWMTFPVTTAKAEKYGYQLYKKVKHRGFLKAGWVAALAKLGLNVKNAQQYLEKPKWGDVTETGNKKNELYMMTIFENVPFFTEWDSGRNRWKTPNHTLDRAIRESTKKWELVLQKYAGREIQAGAFKKVMEELAQEAEKIGVQQS